MPHEKAGPDQMNPVPIQVETLLSKHGDELPQSFRVGERQVHVVEILDRWYERKGDPEWPPADYHKVLGDDQCQYLLKHELESDEWYLIRQWQDPVRVESE